MDLSAVNISKITDMSELFLDSNRTMFYGIDTWDVSHVINMASMFSGAVNFNGDISMWDTSNVEDMSDMFSECPLEKFPPAWYHKRIMKKRVNFGKM